MIITLIAKNEESCLIPAHKTLYTLFAREVICCLGVQHDVYLCNASQCVVGQQKHLKLSL
jgi:hypothetical protein